MSNNMRTVLTAHHDRVSMKQCVGDESVSERRCCILWALVAMRTGRTAGERLASNLTAELRLAHVVSRHRAASSQSLHGSAQYQYALVLQLLPSSSISPHFSFSSPPPAPPSCSPTNDFHALPLTTSHRTMSRARTTATFEHPDPRTDRDLLSAALAPARGSPASSSHSLVISSNLRAALEYEERIRTPLPGSPHHGASIGAGGIVDGGGRQSLPPPPRPKGGPKPKVVHGHVARSSPTGSVSSPASRANDGSSAGANPYINPVPQLSHLMREEPAALIVGDQQGDTQSIGQGSNDSHGTGSSRASPTVSFASPAPSTGVKPESPRHIRGLSSLQKVEKMIGKSKKMLVEGNLKLTGGRRAADASRVGGGELGRRTQAASVLYASSAPSSPISAVSVSLGGTRTMEGGQRGEGEPAAVARRRTEDSHGGRGTVEGDGSAMSEWPSVSPHRPISISSTIYSSSAHSFAHPRSPASRPTAMNDYRESFIELASPTFSPTQDDSRSPYSALASLRDDHPPPPRASVYADDEFSSHPYASTKPLLAPLSTAGKPPIPTSAKPDFSRRSRSAQRPAIEQPSPNTPSPSDSSPDYERALRNRPSTSNLLQPHERADLVRKTRKLTQLFGQTPGVGHYPVDVDLGRAHVSRTNLVGAPPHPSRRKHRPAASMLDDPIVPVYDAQRRVVWPPADDAQYASAGARRRSVPLSPAEFWTVSALSVSGGSRTSSLSITSQDAAHVIEIGSAEGTAQTEDGDSHTDLPDREASPRSPESFIDLSDEEDPAAFPDCRSPATPKGYPLSPLAGPLLSPSTPSIDGLSLSAEQLAEEDRRRKRERLAKLHRFLGSRVPAHLVLGPLDEGLPLPLPASPSPQDDMCGEDADARKLRLRRRRSSSAAEFAGTWSDEIDRLKEDLNDREKAINVRRAVKMEKVRRMQHTTCLSARRAPDPCS